MWTGPTDEKLMLAVRGGDLSKLGVLFDRYHRVLFDFFNRLTGNRTVSEDLVQEVFFRILKYRATFRNDSAFRTWIFRIARNARVDHFRSQGQREIYSGDDEPACEAPSASHQLQQHEDSENLRRAL